MNMYLKSELFKPVLLVVLFTSWPRQARFRCLLIWYCQKSSPPRTDLPEPEPEVTWLLRRSSGNKEKGAFGKLK